MLIVVLNSHLRADFSPPFDGHASPVGERIDGFPIAVLVPSLTLVRHGCLVSGMLVLAGPRVGFVYHIPFDRLQPHEYAVLDAPTAT